MDITTLIDDFAEGIAQDPDVLEWANLTYGQDHRVFVNFDVENPPGESYCPFVMLMPESKRAGQTIVNRSHEVHVVCCVHDSEFRDHLSISNITEYLGVSRLEAFRKLVETALASVDIGNPTIDFDIEDDTISYFPFLWCYMAARVDEPVTMGSDPLA